MQRKFDSHVQETVKEEILQNRRIKNHRFFLGYAYNLFRSAKIYTLWKSFLSYFRKIRMVSILIKVFSIVFGILQTGTLVILTTAVFLVVLPILTAFMLGILLTALLESRSSNKKMSAALDGKEIYVLFLSKQENSFLKSNAKSLASMKNRAVIIVSPYWISRKGLTAGHFFSTVRKEYENVYLVRRYYFFKLKKQVLGNRISYLF